jgi:thiopurine S-methyltransferase
MTLSSEDREAWLARWREGRTRFHLDQVHPALMRYISQLPSGGRILVPLCGKSLDLGWLKNQGYDVVGVELAEQAVSELFEPLEVEPTRTPDGPFEIWKSPGLSVYVGDIFELTADLAGTFDAIWDRAALIALNPTDRARYTPHILSFLKKGSPVLLSALLYDQQKMSGPPFSVNDDEIHRLYAACQSLEKLQSKNVTSRNPMFIEAGLDAVTEHIWLIK